MWNIFTYIQRITWQQWSVKNCLEITLPDKLVNSEKYALPVAALSAVKVWFGGSPEGPGWSRGDWGCSLLSESS